MTGAEAAKAAQLETVWKGALRRRGTNEGGATREGRSDSPHRVSGADSAAAVEGSNSPDHPHLRSTHKDNGGQKVKGMTGERREVPGWRVEDSIQT